MTNKEHLQWIHDRIVNVYNVNENADFLIKFRAIIAQTEQPKSKGLAQLEKILNIIASFSIVVLCISLLSLIWTEGEIQFLFKKLVLTTFISLIMSVLMFGLWCYEPKNDNSK